MAASGKSALEFSFFVAGSQKNEKEGGKRERRLIVKRIMIKYSFAPPDYSYWYYIPPIEIN
jgi:hypothetical protein